MAPEFPCSNCIERLVIDSIYYKMSEWNGNNPIDPTATLYEITGEISERIRQPVSTVVVEMKITELRARYIAFRRFCKKPGVDYYHEENTVFVDEAYEITLKPRETAAERKFRQNGLEDFSELNYILLKKLFPNFPHDIPYLVMAPNEFSDNEE